MRAGARGFILLSFAFTSVLSSEVVQVPSESVDAKTNLEATTYNSKEETQKKNIKSIDLKSKEINHGLEKRSAEIFSQNYNGEEPKKKESYESLQDPNVVLDRDEIEKRTRMGFTGMRGKKEFSSDDYCAKLLRKGQESNLDFNKRLSRSSVGFKRAPIAFHGMRGKKSEDYENDPMDAYYDLKNRDFLIGSGLLENDGLEFPPRRLQYDEELEGGFSKRSPYAFQGMRGKKETAYDLKRAMGFLGMRGKKATEIWDSDANYKRVPQTSFFGMKGKKAQSNGFFGMRGKKASPSAFFGIKGKREPFDYDFQDSSLSQEKELETSRNRFRRGIAWLNNSKKARNAFFGIRGKKSTQDRLDPGLTSSFE